MTIKEKLQNDFTFVLEMEVRDYELDTEKIVNNANYLHYLEHTRHKFCETAGYPFIRMVNENIITVVKKINLEYFVPLKSGDSFFSCLNIYRKGPRFLFIQNIYKTDGQLSISAEITVVAIKDGKVSRGDEIARIFNLK